MGNMAGVVFMGVFNFMDISCLEEKMKTVDQIIVKFIDQIVVVHGQLVIIKQEEDGLFGEASIKLEDALCEMNGLREELYPHEDRITKEAE